MQTPHSAHMLCSCFTVLHMCCAYMFHMYRTSVSYTCFAYSRVCVIHVSLVFHLCFTNVSLMFCLCFTYASLMLHLRFTYVSLIFSYCLPMFYLYYLIFSLCYSYVSLCFTISFLTFHTCFAYVSHLFLLPHRYGLYLCHVPAALYRNQPWEELNDARHCGTWRFRSSGFIFKQRPHHNVGYTDRIAFAHFALQWDQWAKGFGRSGVVVFGRVLFLLVVGPMICWWRLFAPGTVLIVAQLLLGWFVSKFQGEHNFDITKRKHRNICAAGCGAIRVLETNCEHKLFASIGER